MAKCVTCGIDVDEKNAAVKSKFKGETYYFCSSMYLHIAKLRQMK